MKPKSVDRLGMPLDEWVYKSCVAHCAVGEDWATIYDIQSGDEGKGHATRLLVVMKAYYEKQGLRFGGSIALNDRMHRQTQEVICRLY